MSEGRIAARDVARAIQRREKLIREIREQLEALGAGTAVVASRVARRARPVVARAARRAVKASRKGAARALSATTRAKYQAQGRYMAAVRTLPKAFRVRVRKIREKSGVDAAIRAAKAMAKRKPVMRHSREG